MSPSRSSFSRRKFLQSVALASGASLVPGWRPPAFSPYSRAATSDPVLTPLEQFGYGDVAFDSALHEQQLQQTHALLMELSEDSLLKPFRQMVGQPAPGEDLGGWYQYDPNNRDHLFEIGFAPGCTFGQWVSALARSYAINRSPETREKVLRLNRLYAKTIGGEFYENTRFPAYTYDKLVCGLIDSHEHVDDPDAFAILAETTKAALPHFHRKPWNMGKAGARIIRMTNRIRGTSRTRCLRICFWLISAVRASNIANWDVSTWTMFTMIRWQRGVATWKGGMLTVM